MLGVEWSQRIELICILVAITALFWTCVPTTLIGPEGVFQAAFCDHNGFDETRVFAESYTVDDYVDSAYGTPLYGSHSSLPPNGMGNEDQAATSLSEAGYAADEWVPLVVQSSFSSMPSGWDDNNIGYGSYFHRLDHQLYTAYLACPAYDTTGCKQIRFVLSIGGLWEAYDGLVYVKFFNGTTWNTVKEYSDGSVVDQTITTASPEYMHSSFSVRVGCVIVEAPSADFSATNWRLHKLVDITSYRFQAVYSFAGVNHYTYNSEELYVNLSDQSDTDVLEFRFASMDTTPDNLIMVVAGNVDFHVNIHDYLTGSQCYVEIRDVDRSSSDGSPSTWAIEAMYIRLTNSNPEIDATPVTSGLVGGSFILAEYNYVTVSTSVSDVDGAGQIDQVTLSVMDQSYSTEQFSLVYTEGSPDTFSEGTNPDYVILNASDCSVSKSANGIDLVFAFTTDFDLYPITSAAYNLSVIDYDGGGNCGLFAAGWNAESRLSLSAELDDGMGTPDRGDLGGSIQASGVLSYLGQPNIHPLLGKVDLSVDCADVSGSPWTATDYTETDGTFSVLVTADDEVGLDVYSFRARSASVDLLYSDFNLTYIADRIVCRVIYSAHPIVDSTVPGYMNVRLQYEYDDTQVTNGTYLLEGLPLFHLSDDEWQASYEPETLMMTTYDAIEVENNTHGLTVVDMSGHSLTMYWEELMCYVSGPDMTTITLGSNASGIVMWAEYYFWTSHGNITYTGALHLNDTTFIYNTPGRRGYSVLYADGDDAWGVFTVHSSNATYCIWDYPGGPPGWLAYPSDQMAEYACEFVYPLEASIPCLPGTWWLDNRSQFDIDGLGVVRNVTKVPVGDYPLKVFLNDTYGRRIDWEFTIHVRDRTAPRWVAAPANKTIEYGAGLSVQFLATDQSDIVNWSVNDTENFTISTGGLLGNLTTLQVHTYSLNVTVRDLYGNKNWTILDVLVRDRTSPTWVDGPENQVAELGAPFGYDLSADDLSELGLWWVSDTANFTVDSTGLIRNNTVLNVGTYFLRVGVSDIYGNELSGNLTILVRDTTRPSWTAPGIQYLNNGQLLQLQLGASDLSGIGGWSVNDTSRFAIDSGDILVSRGPLAQGVYNLNVSVWDIYNNTVSGVVRVVVQPSEPPDMTLILLTLGVSGAVLVVSVHTWRLVKKGRATHAGEGPQNLEEALEYLDKIPPPPDVDGDDNT